MCKTHHHTCKAINNQPCWFPIQKCVIMGKAKLLSVSKKAALRLSNNALNIMFMLKHHVNIMESKGDIMHAWRCNWICVLMVLCWICGRFIMVDLDHWCQLLTSIFDMSFSYMSKGLLWHLILYVERHLICNVTFGEIIKGKGECHF